MRLLRTIACAAIAALAAGCAGHGLAPSAPAAAGPAKRSATLRIVVKIPKAGAHKRHHRYISPATKSMTISFVPGTTGTALQQTINLTPTTEGCGPSLASTVCTRTLTLAPGRYTASIATYDAIGGGGTKLSSGQNLAVHIVAGAANQLQMTLNGIPHAILITGLTPGAHGSQGAGFTLYGNTAQKFNVVATDADNAPIVGPGAPTFATSFVTGSGWVAPTPAPATPNTIGITPGGSSGATATIRLTATYNDSTCGANGAVCTADVALTHHLQNAWVLDYATKTIDEMAYPYTGTPLVTISDTGGNIGGTNQNAQGFALDANGDIFVANCSTTCGLMPADSVTEYAPPSSTPVRTLTMGIANPEALAVDSSGDLFVANQNGSVTEYGPLMSDMSPIVTITDSVQVPVALALDASNNLYVLNCATSCAGTGSNAILKYAPGYTGTPATIGSVHAPMPGALIVDSSGDVFAGTQDNAVEYPAGSATANVLSVYGEAASLGLDGSSSLFIGQCNTGCLMSPTAPDALLEFAPPYTAAAKTLDSTTIGSPMALAVDGAGNLIVANGINDYLQVFAWPYSSAPQNGATLGDPIGIILTP